MDDPDRRGLREPQDRHRAAVRRRVGSRGERQDPQRGARLRLVETNVWKGTGRSTAASVIQNGNGKVYFWGYTGHAIGVARRDDKYYVFDPDRGLEELLSTTEFKQHIEKDYAKYIKDDGWTLVQVEPDPKQLHLVVPPKGK